MSSRKEKRAAKNKKVEEEEEEVEEVEEKNPEEEEEDEDAENEEGEEGEEGEGDEDDDDEEQAEEGAIDFELANNLRKGSMVMLKDKPCKVLDFAKSKPGKHGAAKILVTGQDVFTGKKVEESVGSGDRVPVPVIKRTEYEVLNMKEDGTLMLKSKKDGKVKNDYKVDLEDEENEQVQRLKDLVMIQKKKILLTLLSWKRQEALYTYKEIK